MEGQAVQNSTTEPTLTPVQVPEPKTKFPVMYLILSLLTLVFLASTAFLYYQNMQLKNVLASYQTQPTVSPTPITYQSPVPTIDLTVNWKTYESTKYGFSVKYNPAFSPEEVAGSVQQLALIGFGSMKNNGYDIEISTGDKLDYYKNRITDHVAEKIDKEERVSVGGVIGTKLTYKQVIVIDEFDVSQVIINKNDRDYIITALASDIDQILSTFKFTK